MAHYAFKECCYDIDYPKFKELIAKFEQGLGSECDHDANYDGDYWLIAAMWINELRESEKSQAKRIAELKSSLSDATEAQQVLGLKLSHAEHEAQVYRSGNAPLEEKIERLEAERDALKVDAAKQFQSGHAAGLERAAVIAEETIAHETEFGRWWCSPAADAIRAMKEQA